MNESDLQDKELDGSAKSETTESLSPDSRYEDANEECKGPLMKIPGLKRILGSMLFGAKEPLSVPDIRGLLDRVAERSEQAGAISVKESEIREELERLNADLIQTGTGIQVLEAAGGFRLVTDPDCGPWLRELLNIGKPPRLSRPALETLAIIAFRQPVMRPEIEAVRGVNVDSIVRNLLDAQLIKVTGRSDLPGRPMMYGTTQLFLDHFGLKNLKDLPCLDELCRREQKISEIKTAPSTPPSEEEEDRKNDLNANSQEENAGAAQLAGNEEQGALQ